MEYDADIERDLCAGNIEVLAFLAQDLRDIMCHVPHRSLLAALKRKKKAEDARGGDSG